MRASVRTLELDHSWPLFERGRRFDLGHLIGDDETETLDMRGLHACALLASGTGLWTCELADDALCWSPEIYDLFGLPRDVALDRGQVVKSYAEPSRAAMERLRAHAIRHRRGFTIDAEIRPAHGSASRWMRLIAAPVCEGGRVVRLQGLKRDITDDYR